MGTVTYPEPAVVREVEGFVPLQINVREDASKPIVQRFHQVWTPDVRILTPDGFDCYHWNGYLPPFEYIPQLLVAKGMVLMTQHDYAGASATYEDVLRRYPTSAYAPEAQYFLSSAKYEASGNASDLLGGWHQLQARYPNSIWRVKQSFSETP